MRIPVVFLFASILIGGLFVWLGQVDDTNRLNNIAAPRSGAPAPDFTLVDLEGNSHTLSDYEGRPVIINFWATWCAPCATEMPAFQKVYDRYREDGLIILAVNNSEAGATIQAFMDERDLDFPVLLDAQFEATFAYDQNAFPTTFFIDRDGRIQHTEIGGSMSEAFIASKVSKIIK